MLWKGIGKRLRELLQSREFGDEFYAELEDAMIEADMGVRIASETSQALREAAGKQGIKTREGLRAALKELVKGFLVAREIPLVPGALNVFLILGVNGVGKTTTIAKLAHHFMTHRGVRNILLVAGDTFRAAAIEQLKLLGGGSACPSSRRSRAPIRAR